MIRLWAVRFAGIAAVLGVIGFGAWLGRGMLSQTHNTSYPLSETPESPNVSTLVTVDAGAGVRVNVKPMKYSPVIEVFQRSVLASTTTELTARDTFTARCNASPLPGSQCVIWIAVHVPPGRPVLVRQRPGAVVSHDPRVNIAVEQMP